MNNKIKLMAVLFMIVGVLAGCNKNEDSSSENKIPQQTSTNKITNSSDSSSSHSSSEKEKTKEELFTEFKKVYSNSSLEEEFTLQIVTSSKSTDASSSFYLNDHLEEAIYTFNKENNIGLAIYNSNYIYNNTLENITNVEKLFNEEDKKYFYRLDEFENESFYSKDYNKSFNYYKVDDDYIFDIADFSNIIMNLLPNIKDDTTFETYGNSFMKVIKENSYLPYRGFDSEFNIDIVEEDDGLELSVDYKFNIDMSYDLYESQSHLFEGSLLYKVEDSKIKQISSNYIFKVEYYYEYEGQKTVYNMNKQISTFDAYVSYEFDKELFDSVETRLPEDVTPVVQNHSTELTLNLDGLEVDIQIPYTKHTTDFKKLLISEIEHLLGSNLRNATIDTNELYLDKEKEQKLDLDNLTLDQLKEINVLYGSIDVEEGYTIVQHILKKSSDLSSEYEICLSKYAVSKLNRKNQVELRVVPSNSVINFYYYSDFIIVNGEDFSDETSFEAGEEKMYIIEYHEVMEEKDVFISDLFMLI